MLKRILSVISICTIGTLCTSSVFAYTDYKDTEETELLSALDIMTGYKDGTFRPDNILTRSEAVKLLTVICGGKEQADAEYENKEGLKELDELPFSDVHKNLWSWSYWNYALNAKIINGFEDGTARPEESLTYAQFVKMLVSCVGYNMYAEEEGGYPNGYLRYGEQLGITKGITADADGFVTREDAAKMTAKAINVPLCVPTGAIEDSKPVFVIMNGDNGYYRTLIEATYFYKADILIQSVENNMAQAKILESKNFNNELYNGTENYIFSLDVNGFLLKENETYSVIVKQEDTSDGESYVLKLVSGKK